MLRARGANDPRLLERREHRMAGFGVSTPARGAVKSGAREGQETEMAENDSLTRARRQ